MGSVMTNFAFYKITDYCYNVSRLSYRVRVTPKKKTVLIHWYFYNACRVNHLFTKFNNYEVPTTLTLVRSRLCPLPRTSANIICIYIVKCDKVFRIHKVNRILKARKNIREKAIKDISHDLNHTLTEHWIFLNRHQ